MLITPEELRIAHRAKKVEGQSKRLDPDDNLDWYALMYGFYLGAGLSTKRAREFTLLTIYNRWLDVLPPLPKPKQAAKKRTRRKRG